MTTPSFVLNVDLPELNITNGEMDVQHVEEQLRGNPTWASLPTNLKNSVIQALQLKVAKTLLQAEIQQQQPPTPAPVESTERLRVTQPKRSRRGKKKGDEENKAAEEGEGQEQGASA
jgi:hypothetical protein